MPAIGVITFELTIPHARSLKDKRQIVKSLKDRLRGKFNVAVSEIDHQDIQNHALLAAVTVSPSRAFAEKVLHGAEREALSLLGPIVTDCTIEWLV